MEKLSAYLKDKPKGDFAKALGTSPSYLSQLMSGYRRPSFQMMLKIERLSEGEVDLHSWSPSDNTTSERDS